jgi:hypothetical protein
VAGERTYAILPCRALDEIVPFYDALGFVTTYRQERPNPYLVVRREDLQLHFAGIDGFDPEQSYGSVIVVVPDAEALHREFAAGLRAAFGRVPTTGIPRLLRPRRKRGTVGGFSVVDPGGNWLRVSRAGDSESAQPVAHGLALAVESAARLGDAKGDDVTAARMLDAALLRHAAAPAAERLPALVYRAELANRLGDDEGLQAARAEARSLPLGEDERERLAAELENL